MDIQYKHARIFRKALVCLALSIVVTACKSRRVEPLQAKDSDMTIQVVRLPDILTDDSSYTYKARLTPQKLLLADKSQEDKNALFYRMDSCFYLQVGTQKIFASLVQPVANGISGSFEYLLQFQRNTTAFKKGDFIYQDKYLNQKKYSLKLSSGDLE